MSPAVFKRPLSDSPPYHLQGLDSFQVLFTGAVLVTLKDFLLLLHLLEFQFQISHAGLESTYHLFIGHTQGFEPAYLSWKEGERERERVGEGRVVTVFICTG